MAEDSKEIETQTQVSLSDEDVGVVPRDKVKGCISPFAFFFFFSILVLETMLTVSLVKWYRGTYYNATILGICNFLAPGIWGGE